MRAGPHTPKGWLGTCGGCPESQMYQVCIVMRCLDNRYMVYYVSVYSGVYGPACTRSMGAVILSVYGSS